MTVLLNIEEIHWMAELRSSKDFCAHSYVEFSIDGDQLVSPKDGNVAAMTTAILLLRSFEKDQNLIPPAYQLFPCCGFNYYKLNEWPYIAISGCPMGIDFKITINNSMVSIETLSDEKKKIYEVELFEWKQVVLNFSRDVLKFYDTSAPKDYSEADKETADNHMALMSEWRQRHFELQDT